MKHPLLPAILAGVLTLPAGLAGQTPIPAPVRVARAPVPDIPYKKFTLRNGLTLLVHEDHKAPIAAVNIWYHVGSKNEKPGKTGFAHLFEHLMFNGSENFNDDYFKAHGTARRDGPEWHDQRGPHEFFPERPDFGARPRRSGWSPTAWATCSARSTRRGSTNSAASCRTRSAKERTHPTARSRIIITENTFPKGHPYSWTVIGSMDDLNAATLDDVHEWFKQVLRCSQRDAGRRRRHRPRDDIRQKVEHYFGDIPSGPPILGPQAWVAKLAGDHRQIMQDRVPQARIYKVWNVPEYGSADLDYLALVDPIFSSRGKTSRLYKRLVYRGSNRLRHRRLHRCARDGEPVPDRGHARNPGAICKAVERAFDEETGKLLADGPTAEELERVKTQQRRRFCSRNRADRRLRGKVGCSGARSGVSRRSRNLQDRPATDCQRHGRSGARGGKALARRRSVCAGGATLPEVRRVAATTVDRKQPPDVGAPPAAPLAAPERATLSNGLKVILSRRTTSPTVRSVTILEGGYRPTTRRPRDRADGDADGHGRDDNAVLPADRR